MSLPRFHFRISNAFGPLASSSGEMMKLLSSIGVTLEITDVLADQGASLSGFLLAVNLCARLYPRLHIVAPEPVCDKAAEIALGINPDCDVIGEGGTGERLLWGAGAASDDTVTVGLSGWSVLLDDSTHTGTVDSNPLTAQAAAALGVSQLFRSVFRQFIGSGRHGPAPARLNLLSLDDVSRPLPELPSFVDIGTFHLAGAGAVGQAMLHALREVPISGRIVVVDPETIELSNLQRYVLATDSDIGVSKCAIAKRRFQGTKVEIIPVETVWGADERSTIGVEQVAVALDSAGARIDVQAGLPRRIYNAWTQPADLGWSRHERFGVDPCLACLYVPSGQRPSQHELIARALQQAELRVLAYLTLRLPVDVALAPEQIPRLPMYPIPSNASGWSERSILEDIISNFGLNTDTAAAWKGKLISDFYREGICGGALITDRVGELPQEVIVPLAHQSVLAGIMLATQLVVSRTPELRELRAPSIEARLNLLSELPQVIGRPRQRTAGCLCTDTAYVSRYREKWEASR